VRSFAGSPVSRIATVIDCCAFLQRRRVIFLASSLSPGDGFVSAEATNEVLLAPAHARPRLPTVAVAFAGERLALTAAT
jgi:hypothetical protein